jgi:hypothetical protein
MRDAGEAQDRIWRVARWAKNRAEGKATQVIVPTLKQGAVEAHDSSSKAAMLKEVHFPPPVEADLDDLVGFQYPREVNMPSELTVTEVTQAILSTKKDNAPGPDGIPNRVLHRISCVSPALLRNIFQACLNLGIQPKRWKEATVVMLRKPGKPDYTDPKAYRPIALLNTLGKALETVVAKRVRFLAETHALLPHTQMGARKQRSVDTALHLLLEKVHTVWAGNKPRVATLLSLDVASAFDRVSHTRLTHNLRKRKMPIMLSRWIANFLTDRKIEVRVAGYTQPLSTVHAGIPQGSPLSPILYLFYNADLLESLENKGLCTSAAGFVDDVNILTYGLSTRRNCEVLKRMHLACETWAKRHGSKFNPQKYDLIHFTRRPQRFDMGAGLTIEGQQISPSTDIRVLGVRLDSALRWRAHLRAVEAKATSILNAFSSITRSTWGMSLTAGRKLYTAIARPIITYGANAWYTPITIKGHRKTVVNKLKALQGKCLRAIAGAYRATSTEAVEIETYIQPIDIYLDGLVAKTVLRTCASQASKVAEDATRRIRQQMRSKRGRLARVQATEATRKRDWIVTTFGAINITTQPVVTHPPWKEDQGLGDSDAQVTRIGELQRDIKKNCQERWQIRWQMGEKGQHLRELVPCPTQAVRKLHAGRTKPESAILIQLRTGKIGFNAFLYERRVPGVWSRRCTCEQGAMTVRHVLLVCPEWQDTRRDYVLIRKDIKWALTTREGTSKAIRFVLQTGLLEQFRLYARKSHETRR